MKTLLAATFLLLGITGNLISQTLTWDGATNNNWSTNPADVNWTGSAWTNGNDAVFNPASATVTVIGAISANNVLLNSGADVTLTGAGSLDVTGNTPLQLGAGGASPQTATTLDMSGLTSFTYSGGNIFRVGLRSGSTGSYGGGTQVSTVTLAGSNTITASTLHMGDVNANSGGGRSTLNLGQTTTINANTVTMGATGRSSAIMQFNGSLVNPSATFRATDGFSAIANWNVGRVTNFNTNI